MAVPDDPPAPDTTALPDDLRVRLAAAGACAIVTFQAASGRVGRGGGGCAGVPAVAAAFAAVGRALPGAVRVVVLRGEAWELPAVAASAAQPGGVPSGAADRDHDDRDARACDDGPVSAWWDSLGWLADRADLVSVAAVQGTVSGAGLGIALACDLRVVSVDTTFALPEAGLGLLPGPGVAGRLVDLVGYPTALDLCLTGRRLTADEAVAAGLAQRMTPLNGLDSAVESLVCALLAVPRDIAVEAKALLHGASGRSRRDQLAAERAAVARVQAAYPAG
jgi:enoyl-CoA hydratase/carnithine racemase